MTAMWSANGRVLRPDEPIPAACRLHRAGTAQTIAGGGATTRIDFDALDFVSGHSTNAPTYNLTNDSITIVQPGYYIVRASVSLTNSGNADFALTVNKNGSAWSVYYKTTGGGTVTLQSHKLGYFAAGDYLQESVTHTGGSTETTITNVGARPSLTVLLLR